MLKLIFVAVVGSIFLAGPTAVLAQSQTAPGVANPGAMRGEKLTSRNEGQPSRQNEDWLQPRKDDVGRTLPLDWPH